MPTPTDPKLVPIFIVGCPRSGTTLTQSLLGAHSALASFPETHFFPLVIPNRPIVRRLGVAGTQVRPRLLEFLSEVDAPDLARLLPRFGLFIHQYTGAFVQILDELTARQQKRAWIEKTPGHVHYMDEIQRYIGPVKFIHVVRSAPDTIASLYQVTHEYPSEWFGPYSLEQCVQRWINDVRVSLAYQGQPMHKIVCYEALVEDTEQTLRSLCEFAGLPFEKEMLHTYTATAAAVSLANEPWKHAATGEIARQETSKFTRILDEAQQQYVLDTVARANLLDLSLVRSGGTNSDEPIPLNRSC